MRIANFFFSILFLTVFTLGATANPTGNSPKSGNDYKTEITKTLNNLDLSEKVGEVFDIKFMITSANELIVISTSEPKLDETIKSALNYKKVDTAGLEQNRVYTVPVRIKA